MDLTPLVPSGKHVAQRYGNGRFVIAGIAYPHSILLSPYEVLPWAIQSLEQVTLEGIKPILGSQQNATLELLLLGCGKSFSPPPRGLRQELEALGTALEPMDTGAACRTFNVLASEDRRVAAALICI
ncbi:MAG: Mth938-like domain-containing protein [Alphaproteobacteria bacterium]